MAEMHSQGFLQGSVLLGSPCCPGQYLAAPLGRRQLAVGQVIATLLRGPSAPGSTLAQTPLVCVSMSTHPMKIVGCVAKVGSTHLRSHSLYHTTCKYFPEGPCALYLHSHRLASYLQMTVARGTAPESQRSFCHQHGGPGTTRWFSGTARLVTAVFGG